ncbi:MAG: 3-methyl-2-oxobutanoate hydroxymethyltransferase, partial [Pigmentiphaga sp.]
MLTCYDAGFARAMDAVGVDSILVGDTLGMVVQGHDSTLPVTVADVAYHIACVARGTQHPWLVADMPFGSYHESPEQALRNAVALMQAGAQMVKLEGGADWAPTVRKLAQSGVPVCAHVGLLPQQIHAMGGFRVQGREQADADRIVADALALEAAGAAMMVIEGVPEPVARRICDATTLLTIGIGASPACDGQVLVIHDMLGLTPRPARFVKDFATAVATEGKLAESVVLAAFRRYVDDVASGRF